VSLSTPFLKVRTSSVLRARELVAYVSDLRGKKTDNKNVLIFGQGRSGSTLFETLLVSTGYFVGLHEVLNTVTREVWWPDRYVRGLGRQYAGRNVIVHVKPEHLGRARKRPVDTRSFLELLILDGWTLVHIQRRDVLRQLLSKYVAKARGGFHKREASTEAVRLSLPLHEFILQYQRRLGWLEAERTVLEGLPHTTVIYEENLERPETQQLTVNSTLEYLGLEKRPASSTLKKINTYRPEELLENLEDLRAAFLLRNWEWTL
jgi:LPS sulfotransferase NodH